LPANPRHSGIISVRGGHVADVAAACASWSGARSRGVRPNRVSLMQAIDRARENPGRWDRRRRRPEVHRRCARCDSAPIVRRRANNDKLSEGGEPHERCRPDAQRGQPRAADAPHISRSRGRCLSGAHRGRPRQRAADLGADATARCRRLASALLRHGLARGDVVAAMLPNVPAMDEWDAIALNYTSGTTGDPKGVVYSPSRRLLNAVSNVLEWDMPKHPVYLWTLPMFHCNGWCFPWTMAARAGTSTSACARSRPKAIFDADPQRRRDAYVRRADRHAMLVNAPRRCAGHQAPCADGGRRRAAGRRDRGRWKAWALT
jgi:hypothetical protein